MLRIKEAANLILDVYQINVAEGGSGTVDVRLAADPGAEVTVTIASEFGDVTASPSPLTFTPGSLGDWSTPKTVTIDAGDLEAGDYDLVVFSASGGAYQSIAPVLTVDITGAVEIEDNDFTVTIDGVDDETVTTVAENDSKEFQVSLDSRPSSNVTIAVTHYLSEENARGITWSPASLTFTPDNWTTKIVEITGKDDTDADDETQDVLTFTPTQGDPNIWPGTALWRVQITVEDDDEAQLLAITDYEGDAFQFDEGSGGGNYIYVKMATPPTAPVTWAISVPPGQTPSLSFNPASLPFTSENYTTETPVEITIGDDNVNNGNQNVTLTFTATGGGADIAGKTFTQIITIVEDDIPAILTEVEGAETDGMDILEGRSATFEIKLSQQPTGPVTVLIMVPPNMGLVSPADPPSLTFTMSNWDETQPVIITTTTDADSDDETVRIHLIAQGGGYDGNIEVTPVPPVVSQ